QTGAREARVGELEERIISTEQNSARNKWERLLEFERANYQVLGELASIMSGGPSRSLAKLGPPYLQNATPVPSLVATHTGGYQELRAQNTFSASVFVTGQA